MNATDLFGRLVFWWIVVRLTCTYLLAPIVRILFRPKPVWQTENGRCFAVITGGTDGIGLAYSKYLASTGYRLLIISRTASKLAQVKQQLEETIENCPEIRTLAFDFSTPDFSAYEAIEKELSGLPGRVDVLVNNVGVSFATCEYFTVISSRQSSLLRNMISVNTVSAIKMTEFILPAMIRSNRGVIINVGSQSAVSPVPLLALYSATKAFVDHFTLSVARETSKVAPGVIIQSVLPGFVATKMSHLRTSWRVPNPDVFVDSAMKRIGLSLRTFGFWYHSLVGVFYSLTDSLFGENFNCWLALTILSGYRKKYYRSKRIAFDTFFD